MKSQGTYSATKLGQKQGDCLCHHGLWFPRTLAESNILTNMVLIEAYYTLVLKIFRGFFALVNSLVRSMTTTKLGSMTVTKSCYKSLISDHIPKYEKKSNLI